MKKVRSLPTPYFIYCWRGGGRSRFVSSHLHSQGHDIFRIDGGYKSYRAHIQNFYGSLLNQPPSLLVLAGLTGSGKTQLLNKVASFWPTVNLESAAQHCGSVFGHIPYKNASEKAAVSQSRFESLIFSELNENMEDKEYLDALKFYLHNLNQEEFDFVFYIAGVDIHFNDKL